MTDDLQFHAEVAGPGPNYIGATVPQDYNHVLELQIVYQHISYMMDIARTHWERAWLELGQPTPLVKYHQRASAHYYAGAQAAREVYIERTRPL